jgi:hypothetical protein
MKAPACPAEGLSATVLLSSLGLGVAILCCQSPRTSLADRDAGACAAGERTCRDRETALVCRSGRFEVQACPAGSACHRGFCAPILCTPGPTGRCATDTSYEVCNEAGTAIDFVFCAPGTVCSGTGCIGPVCTSGERRCKPGSATLVEQCSPSGGAWLDAEDCGGEETGKVCFGGRCEFLCLLETQVKSNLGCDYWAVKLDNATVPGANGGWLDANAQQYAVIVCNTHPQYAARVTVENHAGVVAEAQVPPNDLHIFELPRQDVHGTLLAPKAYRIRSSIPIVAYQFNPLDNVGVFSNDASLLLPNTSLGRRYLVMSRPGGIPILSSGEQPPPPSPATSIRQPASSARNTSR